MLDALARLNQKHLDDVADPETQARIAQYEMAFRMQSSVPSLMEVGNEPRPVMEMYGPDVYKPGTFAASCLLARRMVERGVRFVQIFLRGWDHHGGLTRDMPLQCGDIDHACFGLIRDLKQRGLLDETLVVWGGEFGRTPAAQGTDGRNHNNRGFSMWMAGGGIKGGLAYGKTDDYGATAVENPMHMHDLHATVLNLLGLDHEKLTYRYAGRDFRLTDVYGNVAREIIA
jgi:hypothetical protein